MPKINKILKRSGDEMFERAASRYPAIRLSGGMSPTGATSGGTGASVSKDAEESFVVGKSRVGVDPV